MERSRSGTERTPCCRRAHRPQRADHATSRIGHETAPNRLSRLLPHHGFHLGAEGLSRPEPEVRIHLPPAQRQKRTVGGASVTHCTAYGWLARAVIIAGRPPAKSIGFPGWPDRLSLRLG
jgi:hypothetical protein